MNKVSIVVLVLVLVALGYFVFSSNKTEAPSTTGISGTVAHSEEAKEVDQQAAAAAAASLISTSPGNAAVFILEPGDGSRVSSPVTVKFGITNMVVAPAGDNVENSGHHHLLINLDKLPPLDAPLPATDQLIHFGAGQTETTIDLEPGEHTLQLVLGNYLHIPHDPPVVSKKITITVE